MNVGDEVDTSNADQFRVTFIVFRDQNPGGLKTIEHT